MKKITNWDELKDVLKGGEWDVDCVIERVGEDRMPFYIGQFSKKEKLEPTFVELSQHFGDCMKHCEGSHLTLH
ncbi:hypothetical protein V6R21_12595 [Limibacter armeniacum]|uniref:hypothetical protein n=1 Tax=Limibacter armeniacum TaxID=466084 RepID=UPI002FE55726